MINLPKEFESHKTMLAVISAQKFPTLLPEMVEQLHNNYSRITYVSLNKLINPLRRSLQERNLDLDRFFFVDAITKTAMPEVQEDDHSLFVPSPEDLTKLSIAITKSLQSFDPDCLVFDSLSTLLIYLDLQTTNQFVHALVNKINAFGVHAVFTSLQDDAQLHQSLAPLVDKVVFLD